MSSSMFPHRRKTTFLVGLVLVDLPVLITVAIAGWFYGYQHTYTVIEDWRMAHPITFAPSLVLLVVLAVRWKRAHR
jgi:uncharacterized membrane protein